MMDDPDEKTQENDCAKTQEEDEKTQEGPKESQTKDIQVEDYILPGDLLENYFLDDYDFYS